MKPKCFVAMAFGYDDTDQVYETALAPAIEKLGFTPRVVNRMNFNEDIDDRIFMELDDCSLCVADLTYSRPSVYYEAGYARARGVPVVHTVRSDHFDRKLEEPYRVHFDLQNKNIIGWKAPDDPDFAERLRDRLALVSRPVLARLADDGARKEARVKFAGSSVSFRIDFLGKVLGGEMKSREFLGGGLVFARDVGTYHHYVRFVVTPRYTSSDVTMEWAYADVPEDETKPFVHQTIYLCLNALRKPTLEAKLSLLVPDPKLKRFFRRWERPKDTTSSRHKAFTVFPPLPPLRPDHIQEVAFIDNVKSAEEALEDLDAILEASARDVRRLLLR